VFLLVLVWSGVTLAACERQDAPAQTPAARAPVDRDQPLFVKAGQRYRLVAMRADPASVGRTWRSPDFTGSPLAPMSRRAVILKADDFGGPLGSAGRSFVDLVMQYGGVAALGIITSRLAASPAENAGYRELVERGFELWLHGHAHRWALPRAEFAGVSLADQQDALRRGMALGRERLGLTFHTFGAPGNAIDQNTAMALRDFPELVVWLFGKADAPPRTPPLWVLPRLCELEAKVGEVLPVEELAAGFAKASAKNPAVITLQVHPLGMGRMQLRRLDDALDYLTNTAQVRFSTPWAEWCWQKDLGRITLTQTTADTFVLDLTDAACDHRILAPTLTALEALPAGSRAQSDTDFDLAGGKPPPKR
jgi:hypothetical protein